jgi:hypothetical protein
MTRKMIRVFFSVLGVVFISVVALMLSMGSTDPLRSLLAVLVIASFLFINYLLMDALAMTRDKLYVALLVALFIWPVITSAVSYYLTGAEALAKKGLEYRIGGFGDCLTVGFMLDVEGLNEQFLTPSLLLMLGTNTAFLVPVFMMYRRATRRSRSDKTDGKTTP